MLKQFFALAILIIATGCAKKPQEVNVQVFIVTKGGENVKLGLVEVRAIPRDKAVAALRPVAAERDAALAKLDADQAAEQKEFNSRVEQHKQALAEATTRKSAAIQAANDAMVQFKSTIKAASAAANAYAASIHKKFEDYQARMEVLDPRWSAISSQVSAFDDKLDLYALDSTPGYLGEWSEYLSDDFGQPNRAIEIVSREVWKGIPDHPNAVIKTARALQVAVEKAKTASAEVKSLDRSPDDDFSDALREQRTQVTATERLFAVLPSPTVSAKTDADGKCRLMLPTDQQWVLAAEGGREIMKEREDYVWIVDLPLKEGASITLMLSNDNLLHPGSDPFPLRP